MPRYLYCVVSTEARPALGEWTGDGAPLDYIAIDDISGVIGSVDEARFGTDALARAYGDVKALAPYASAHQSVVQFVFERAPAVVPLAFGSLHASDEDARRSLERQRDRLAALLARLRGAEEWGLRLARRRARVAVGAGEPGAGAAYLASRRAELRGELDDAARREADELDDAITALSRERRALDTSADLVLRAAYLIDRASVDAVKRTVLDRGVALERVGLAAELSGPWPPYTFVDRETAP